MGRSRVIIGLEKSKIVYPKICEKYKCKWYVRAIYSRCALDSSTFKECRESGFKTEYAGK